MTTVTEPRSPQTDQLVDLPGGRFRILDLSLHMSSTETGHTGHRLDLEHGNFDFDSTSWIRMSLHSHAGTHMELPRNIGPQYTDALDTPLAAAIGWLQLIDLSDLPAGHRLTVQDLEERGLDKVQPGDIAGIFGSHVGAYAADGSDVRVQLSAEAMQALADRGIRAVCMDNGTLAIETTPEECLAMHHIFLGHGMPIFENFYSLSQIPVDRCWFMGFPLPIEGLDSSPVRAVALVPEDAA